MLDLQDRLDELKGLGLYRRMRMVSGPQAVSYTHLTLPTNREV